MENVKSPLKITVYIPDESGCQSLLVVTAFVMMAITSFKVMEKPLTVELNDLLPRKYVELAARDVRSPITS